LNITHTIQKQNEKKKESESPGHTKKKRLTEREKQNALFTAIYHEPAKTTISQQKPVFCFLFFFFCGGD